MELVERLNEYQDVVLDLDQDMTHEADVVLFFTPIMIETDISKYKARKMYQVVHSDIAGLMAYQRWQDFKWSPDARIDKVLSVSDTVQKGIKDKLNVDSVAVCDKPIIKWNRNNTNSCSTNPELQGGKWRSSLYRFYADLLDLKVNKPESQFELAKRRSMALDNIRNGRYEQ